MALEFGIFDHVDRNDLPLEQFYEDRLKLIEAYDRAGIYGYHCAEHHSTPLGMSPSPSVYLAAVAQRTKRLRFGPLVYTLALYHPLRLAEEICMLDQMSRGRLMVGVGKGISPIEVGYYGVDYDKADEMFAEALTVILQALTQKTRRFRGRVLPLQERAVRARAVPEAAPAAVVRRGQSRQRRARGERRHELHRQLARGHGEGQDRALPRRSTSRPAGATEYAEVRHEPLHGAGRDRGRRRSRSGGAPIAAGGRASCSSGTSTTPRRPT